MVRDWVMLCKIISKIVAAFRPTDNKLALTNAITDPIVTHVHGFSTAFFDSLIGNATGRAVVSLDGSGILWESEFHESGSHNFLH
jgi:hypothetical protein